jgi:hypothetical protein
VLAQHVHELQADRIAQSLRHLGHPHRLGALDVGIDDRLTAYTQAIRALVEEGEDIAGAGLAELFAEDPTPIELVRWKDLYERLQAALAVVRRAAGTLDSVARQRR